MSNSGGGAGISTDEMKYILSFMLKIGAKDVNVLDAREEFGDFYLLCESEPELLLLRRLIDDFGLTLQGNVLISVDGTFIVQPQVKIINYRVNFLVNDLLIIEVDGKKYHSNDKAFEHDRKRDQKLSVEGYETLRFYAKQIYQELKDVIQMIARVSARYPQ